MVQVKSKMKVKSSISKRFRVTKNGKIMRTSANRSHKNYHKSSSQKRRLDVNGTVCDADYKRTKKALGL